MCKNIIPASLLFSLISSTPAFAGDWEVYKFAEIGIAGTDNYGLADSDQIEEFVGSVKPSVELYFSGNRFESEVVAEVELYQFNESDFNVVDPRLALSTTGTLVENLLYVSSSLNYAKSLPEDDFFDLGEDSDAQTRFRFNPFLARKFGRFADGYFGYGHQSIDGDTDGKIDTQQDAISFSLARNPKYGGFLWGFGGDYEKDRSDGREFENASVYGSLGATLGQSVFFGVLGGAETNNYSELLEEDKESTMWEVSVKWTPSERTALKVGYGDRFFGEGPTFSLKHRVRNSTFSAGYTRGITTSTDPVLSTVTAFTEVPDTTVVPNDSIDLIGDGSATRESVPYVEKQLRLGYKLAGRRSDFIVDAVYSNQDELTGSAEIENLLGRVVFDRHLSPLTTFRIQYDYKAKIREVGGETESDADENRIGFKFIYNFDRKERASIIKDDING